MALPVISVAQMRQWENESWAAGQTEGEVIRQVGRAVASRARSLTRAGQAILILAGKGHNGEDARAAREHLPDRRVELLDVCDPASDLPRLEELLSLKPSLIIDGLFGIGLNRPLDAAWVNLIQRLNAARLRVLAVDAPSGLDADTGETYGAAVQAELTLTVGAPKTGLLQERAWPYVGRLEVASHVGLAPCAAASDLQWTVPEDFAGFPPRRLAATHKGTYGHLAIFAGSLGFHGAAVLAARGAQRAQPGLITLFTTERAYLPVAAQLQSVMVSPWSDQTPRRVGDFSAFLIGPGLAGPDVPPEMVSTAKVLWRYSPGPVIADASALDWLASGPVANHGLRVLTPHPGEASRLLRGTSQLVQADRVRAVWEISRLYGQAWVMLKGHQTLIGRNAGEVFVNPVGNPHLAQGGSGDLLAGYLGGLLAQSGVHRDPGLAIRYAAWQHGAAADALQADCANWTVEDLAERLGGLHGT
jgi:NAD(P)H-hydrate epimerase